MREECHKLESGLRVSNIWKPWGFHNFGSKADSGNTPRVVAVGLLEWSLRWQPLYHRPAARKKWCVHWISSVRMKELTRRLWTDIVSSSLNPARSSHTQALAALWLVMPNWSPFHHISQWIHPIYFVGMCEDSIPKQDKTLYIHRYIHAKQMWCAYRKLRWLPSLGELLWACWVLIFPILRTAFRRGQWRNSHCLEALPWSCGWC